MQIDVLADLAMGISKAVRKKGAKRKAPTLEQFTRDLLAAGNIPQERAGAGT